MSEYLPEKPIISGNSRIMKHLQDIISNIETSVLPSLIRTGHPTTENLYLLNKYLRELIFILKDEKLTPEEESAVKSVLDWIDALISFYSPALTYY